MSEFAQLLRALIAQEVYKAKMPAELGGNMFYEMCTYVLCFMTYVYPQYAIMTMYSTVAKHLS